jgi:putative iron-only hydrogenase system regulator
VLSVLSLWKGGLFTVKGAIFMETRVAIIGIIVEDLEQYKAINSVLHDYAEYIIGRMGVPYRKKGISIISVAVDAPADAISAIGGGIGALNGVTVKIAYSPTK